MKRMVRFEGRSVGTSGWLRSVGARAPFAAAKLALVLGCSSACVAANHKADTQVEFQETDNIGQACGGPLSSWTVVNRETNDQGTAGCEQPVLFVNLAPGATYTFDVTGYAGSKVCWEGSCQVTAVSGATTYADCASSVAHLCGY